MNETNNRAAPVDGSRVVPGQFQTRPRRILRVPAVCDRVGMSRSVVYVMIKAGTFPRPVPLNDKSVGWIESEIDDWILSRVAARDAQAVA